MITKCTWIIRCHGVCSTKEGMQMSNIINFCYIHILWTFGTKVKTSAVVSILYCNVVVLIVSIRRAIGQTGHRLGTSYHPSMMQHRRSISFAFVAVELIYKYAFSVIPHRERLFVFCRVNRWTWKKTTKFRASNEKICWMIFTSEYNYWQTENKLEKTKMKEESVHWDRQRKTMGVFIDRARSSIHACNLYYVSCNAYNKHLLLHVQDSWKYRNFRLLHFSEQFISDVHEQQHIA